MRILANQRFKHRRQRFQQLHRQRTREFVARRIRFMHVRGERAEEPVPDHEDESRAPIDLARLDQPPPACVHVEALIARTRLAVDVQRAAIRERSAVRQPLRGAPPSTTSRDKP